MTDPTSHPVKPTILLIQGSFQTQGPYLPLIKGIQARGYPTVFPALPSLTNSESPDFPSVDLIDDALAIRTKLIRLIEYEHKTAIVVLHSYGGLVGCEAIPQELSYAFRQEKGLKGGVVHLFFFAAFLLAEGQSVVNTFPVSCDNDIRPDGRQYILRSASTLYNDIPESEAQLWESKTIAQSYAVQKTELTRASWKYIPSTYLVCENDQVAPAQGQEMFAKMANAEVERCTAGHSPMLSQTEMLVGKILRIAEDLGKSRQ